jgi:proteasome lid subunit RPN8/RPN11
MEHLPFLPEQLWLEIKPTFIRAYPCEAIVAIWPDGWRELPNVSPAPALGFAFAEADRLAFLTKPPLVVLHSHPNGSRAPSDRDTEGQLSWSFPWGIVAIDAEPVTGQVYAAHYPECWGAGLPIPPLQGRPYLWGIRDCFTLCQDFYALNGVILPSIPRARTPTIYPKGHWGHDQFLNEPARLNIKPVKRHQRQPGDITRWQFKADRFNHCAIYLGEGRFLHQPVDQASAVWTTGFEEKFIEERNIEFFRPKRLKAPLVCDLEQLEEVSPRPTRP